MVGIDEMDMEGPLTPCMNGGMVGTMVVGVGPPLVGSGPGAVCVVAKGPLGLGPFSLVEGILVMMGETDTIPLPTFPPWNILGCALVMGLDGAVKNVGSY